MKKSDIKSAIIEMLDDPDVSAAVTKTIGNIIYERISNMSSIIPIVESVRSANYIIDNMRPWQAKDILSLRFDAISAAPSVGFFMEFGVWKAHLINIFAKQFPDKHFYGFDSFEGLPEKWSDHDSNYFDLGGKLPQVENNVSLVKGWFNESLPKFLNDHPNDPVSFIHMDCDLYSSTMTVLTLLRDRLRVGTQIVLDDYLLQPGWAQEEHKAFRDFCSGHRIEYAYTGWQNQSPSVSASVVLTRV